MLNLRTHTWRHGQLCAMIRGARDSALVKYMADAEHMRDLAGRGKSASVVASAKRVVFPKLLRI